MWWKWDVTSRYWPWAPMAGMPRKGGWPRKRCGCMMAICWASWCCCSWRRPNSTCSCFESLFFAENTRSRDVTTQNVWNTSYDVTARHAPALSCCMRTVCRARFIWSWSVSCWVTCSLIFCMNWPWKADDSIDMRRSSQTDFNFRLQQRLYISTPILLSIA